MRIIILTYLFSLIIYVKSLGCSETPATSYDKECKTYEKENDLGDAHCCYSEFTSEELEDRSIQKACIYLTKEEYDDTDKFIKDMKEGKREGYIKADITKLDCGSKSSKSSYFILNLFNLLIFVLLLV